MDWGRPTGDLPGRRSFGSLALRNHCAESVPHLVVAATDRGAVRGAAEDCLEESGLCSVGCSFGFPSPLARDSPASPLPHLGRVRPRGPELEADQRSGRFGSFLVPWDPFPNFCRDSRSRILKLKVKTWRCGTVLAGSPRLRLSLVVSRCRSRAQTGSIWIWNLDSFWHAMVASSKVELELEAPSTPK